MAVQIVEFVNGRTRKRTVSSGKVTEDTMAGHGGGRPMAGIGPGNPGVSSMYTVVGDLRTLQAKVEALEKERDQYLAAREKEMHYVCTFAYNQKWSNHYVTISAYDEASARQKMQEKFGNQWSMIYTSDLSSTAEDKAGVKRWGLKKLTDEMLRKAAAEEAKPFNVIEGVL